MTLSRLSACHTKNLQVPPTSDNLQKKKFKTSGEPGDQHVSMSLCNCTKGRNKCVLTMHSTSSFRLHATKQNGTTAVDTGL